MHSRICRLFERYVYRQNLQACEEEAVHILVEILRMIEKEAV